MFTGVCLSTEGVPGSGGCLIQGGMPGPGGSAWSGGGVPGPWGGAWSQGECLVLGGAWWRPPQKATAVGGTHPTGMHSCLKWYQIRKKMCSQH